MPKFLVSLCTIVNLLSVAATEIGNSRVIVNQSFGWDSCLQWPLLGNAAGRNSAEGGKVGLGWWLPSRGNVEEHQEDDAPAENRWSKRSLCGILKTENLPDTGDERELPSARSEATQKKGKTLLDAEDLFSWGDLEDPSDSSASVAHIRVKRQEETTNENSENNYFEQLADSFPRGRIQRKDASASLEENPLKHSDDLSKASHSSPLEDVSKSAASQKKKRMHPRKVQSRKQQKKRKKASRVKAKKRNRQEKANVHPVHSNVHANKRSKADEKIDSSGEESVSKLETIRNAWNFGTDLISKAANKLSSQKLKAREKRNEENPEKHYDSNEESVKKDELIPGEKANDDSKYNAFKFAEEVERLAKLLVAKVGILENYLQPHDTVTVEKAPEVSAIDDLCLNVTVSNPKPESQKSPNECLKTSTPFKIETKTPVKRNVLKRKTRNKTSETSLQVEDPETHENSRHVSKRRAANKLQGKWGRWTDWSSCSVSCGKGRQIRWRYCQHDCEAAEIEMVEKACQLPACPPGKFLGIF